MTLSELRNEILKLNDTSKYRLFAFLETSVRIAMQETEPIIKEKHQKGFVCAHCENQTVIRFEIYKMMKNGKKIVHRQYKCKSCRKSFRDLTNTPLHRTRKHEQWLEFMKCMKDTLFLNLLKSLEIFHRLRCFIGDISC